MAGQPMAQVIRIFEAAKKSGPEEDRQSRLCLTWAVDPVTGRLVARWVTEQTDPREGLKLVSAA
jgi:hypothetical protein